jgi:GWxTD domain-containing protein
MREILVYFTLGALLSAQTPQETTAKPKSQGQRKKDEARLKKELEPHKKWLTEEVGYIITDDERKGFTRLATEDEREQFIEQFWLRRDPTPDTEENEYREEHYRRIAYANERFASGIPGWKTDRGHIYIAHGPPDEIDSHASGGTYQRPYEEGGGSTSTYPFEQWRYRYIDGIGTTIIFEFVDTTMSGEYRLTMDPSEKDALLHIPGAAPTISQPMGLTDKFTPLEQYANAFKPPAMKYKELEAVRSDIKYNLLPMKVLVDYIPITGSSVLTQITIQFDTKDMQFRDKENSSTATVNIFGRILTLSQRPLSPFEDVVSITQPTEMLQQLVAASPHQIYQKTLPLPPGNYKLKIFAKDLVGGNTGTYEVPLRVPHVEDDVLAASSLILADQIEKVATKNIGTGMFVIGGSKVRPRVGETFKRDEKLGIYMQLYNFAPDQTTHKPDGTIDYEIVKVAANQKVFEFSEDVKKLQGGAAQVVIEKLLPLADLDPGEYKLNIRVTDKLRNPSQSLTRSAAFTVK